jgi:hypothetical protein
MAAAPNASPLRKKSRRCMILLLSSKMVNGYYPGITLRYIPGSFF